MDDQAAQSSGLEVVVGAWRRRKWLGILVLTAVFAPVLAIARSVPDIYRSSAMVLVEHQQVADSFVRPSVTGELETRLHTISQEILSRSRLHELITRLGLYPKLTARGSTDGAIDRMRRDVELEPKEVRATSGRGATIAFTLTYRGTDPRTVAQVTNTLASFYVERNVKLRERQAAATVEVLKAQVETMKVRLGELEHRVSDFKGRHSGELPQQVPVNLSILERLNAQLRLNTDRQVRALERRAVLAKQMIELDSVPSPSNADTPMARIARLKQELIELRTRFSEKYPEVIRIRAEIAALQRDLDERPTNGHSAPAPTPPPELATSGPKLALNDADREIKGLKAEEESLQREVEAYQRRIENAPQREQQYQALSRDYDAARELYYSLLKRYEDAQLAESVEHQKGDQFRLLDPAIEPKEPVGPNRMRLVLFGLMVACGLAAGVMVLVERLDPALHSVDDLRALTRVPVLVSIPLITTAADGRRRRFRLVLTAIPVVIGLALIVGVSAYWGHGNEQLAWMLAGGR